MLEKIDLVPEQPPSNPKAERFVPKFIYHDPNYPTPAINIREDFYGSRRRLKVAVLGAGMSCLSFLHHLFELVPRDTVDVTVYDMNEDVGGVWQSTTYPGCRSDSPSATYQIPWRPHIWSQFYAPQEEIKEYLQTVAGENDFYPLMKLRHEVVRAEWRTEEAKWTLRIRDLVADAEFEGKSDMFVECDGPVSKPQILVEGLNIYQGVVVHSGDWPEDLDLKGKRVALMGYGSSGVQLAPNILLRVSKLYTWFRGRAYMAPPPFPGFAYDVQGTNFAYSEQQRALLHDPDVYLAYRKALDDDFNRQFDLVVNGSETSKKVRQLIKAYMQEKLKSKPGLYDMIRYLEALVDEKTTVFQGEPRHFTPNGFLDPDGIEHEVDVVIAATGYEYEHMPRYPKIVDGEDIATWWASRGGFGHTYMAICSEHMPNYFNPGTAYSGLYRSFFQPGEGLSIYMAKVINKMQLERILSFVPKERAVNHFVRHADTFMQRWVQSGPCQAFYKSHGRPRLWPGSYSQYMQILENPRFEDFDMVYEDEDDIFSYFGNGFALHPEGFEEEEDSS
ncbi:hypothetical protein M409DRAFT_70703 [Zasmidium cellare ATCC 36951]|uniref:FAD/NAD(P)-binding domain-containing protein n=1 Tax=Zasmidium cellare ATCC 36951 TaxID=1080233 RepID=A0A6A6BYT0_ZASCE|nr:uncharacterized protein M409DRAFT_70703 [Zasmidium cellare ATCC 36951]KAF2159954.1 hypothetical protein M409DRAFT_70703 [Zasmidium cellare ATCC 36951]